MNKNFIYRKVVKNVKYKRNKASYYNMAMLSFDALIMMGARVDDLIRIGERIKKENNFNEIIFWDWLIHARNRPEKVKSIFVNTNSDQIRNELLTYYSRDDIRYIKHDNKNIRRLFGQRKK